MNSFASRQDAGFTLVEVLIALSIIAASLIGLLIIRNNSIREVSLAMNSRLAWSLAQRKMGEIVIESDPREGTESGEFEDFPQFSWAAVTTLEELATEKTENPADEPEEILRIELEVAFESLDGPAKIKLCAYRLKPADEAPPAGQEPPPGKEGAPKRPADPDNDTPHGRE
jgi:type II secretion system protein I